MCCHPSGERCCNRSRQTVLVVDRGVRHPKLDIAFHQIGFAEIRQRDGLACVVLFDHDCSECAHDNAPFSKLDRSARIVQKRGSGAEHCEKPFRECPERSAAAFELGA